MFSVSFFVEKIMSSTLCSEFWTNKLFILQASLTTDFITVYQNIIKNAMFILSFMENKNVWCYIMLLGKDAKIPLFCAKLCDVYVQFVDFNFESKIIRE